jgi:hypothetical protein
MPNQFAESDPVGERRAPAEDPHSGSTGLSDQGEPAVQQRVAGFNELIALGRTRRTRLLTLIARTIAKGLYCEADRTGAHGHVEE